MSAPKHLSRARFAAVLAVGLMGAAGCDRPVKYVEGPEATDLAGRVHGHLVIKQGRDTTDNHPRILALSLPRRQPSTLRSYPGSDLGGWIETVSGPDRNGRIAFVEERRFQSRDFAVKTIRLDGGDEREEFGTRKGGLTDSFALSPSGKRIAYVGVLTDAQMPGALLTTGPLEIWDTQKKTVHRTGITALTEPLSWFPDSRRLAYVELVPKTAISQEIAAGLQADPKFLGGVEDWGSLPVVYLLDADSGKKTFLHLGWSPLVSLDGRSVILRWGSYRRLELASGEWTRVRWPGQWLPPIALLPGDLLIFPGLPTAGTKARHIKYGSFRVGSQLASIKVVELATGRFQTLVDYADPREKFSFGIVSR